jgi:archaellum component FlaD/FlaE
LRLLLTLEVRILQGYATMGWIKNRLTEKIQDMRENGIMMATDDEIKSKAV